MLSLCSVQDQCFCLFVLFSYDKENWKAYNYFSLARLNTREKSIHKKAIRFNFGVKVIIVKRIKLNSFFFMPYSP